MAKEPQELKWVESLLPEGEYRRKSMFGGFSYYLDEKIIMLMFESSGDRTYRGQSYDFEIWRGCMFPVEKEFQPQALARFPFLVNHPVLPKWLYLPMETENFDELVSEVIEQVVRPQSFWGSIPKGKSKKSGAGRALKIDEKMDTRSPRMFSDEPAEIKLQTVKKISDFKNLGAASEAEFRKAGITPKQFIKMGWKKALTKLVAVNPSNRHSIYAYALIGALQNRIWNGISEEDKKEAREFCKSLKEKPPTPAKKKKSTAKVKAKAKKKTTKRKRKP